MSAIAPAPARVAVGATAAAAGRPDAATRRAALALAAELSLIVVLLLARFGATISTVQFHPDESHWIATSSALEAFLSGDWDAPEWQESYWTLTHPPLTRYVVGIGRRAGGYGVGDLNVPWHFGEDFLSNIHRGALPPAQLLWYSRLPMAILAALSGALGFVLLVRIAGRVAGYCWIAFFVSSDYLANMLSRAMSEAPLLCSMLVVAVLAWRTQAQAARIADATSARQLVALTLLTAIACGLAGGTKLNGLVTLGLLLPLAIWAALQLRRRVQLPLGWCCSGVLLTLGLAILTFVAVNPFLYPAPVTRTMRMVAHRRAELAQQETLYPDQRMPAGIEGVWRLGTRVFRDCAPQPVAAHGLLPGSLCLIGVLSVVAICRSAARREAGAAALALLAVALLGSLPVFFSPLDWDRYYLLPVVFAMAFSAIGVSVLVALAESHVRRWRCRTHPAPGLG